MKPYLTIADIQRAFKCNFYKAKKIWLFASALDDEELGRYRVDDRKVRIESVLKVTKTSLKTLERINHGN